MFDILQPSSRSGSSIQSTELIRIFIADGQRLFREALAHLLEQEEDLTVVGLAGSITEVLECSPGLLPDILVLDAKLPVISGVSSGATEHPLSLVHSLKEEYPDMRILLLVPFISAFSVVNALATGANGYLLKETSAHSFVAALRSIWAGEQVLTPEIMPQLLRQIHHAATSSVPSITELTARERELFLLVARGMVAKEIARLLSISEKTVRNHLSNIYRKLDLYDRSQIVLYAVRHGLVNPQQEVDS